MNFVGTGKRLEQGDIGYAARQIGVETAVLLAFIEVEAAGRGFDKLNRPKMLRETHKFYAELRNEPSKLALAVKLGLATKNWTRNYKSDSYPDLQRMIGIDKDAGLRSCSWGLSQILGSNCEACGFKTAEEFVKAAMQGERQQLLQMVMLMAAWKMGPMLTGRDFTNSDSWRPAARKWNGSGYATHNYHGRMAVAYIKHSKGTPMVTPITAVLQTGMKGEAVRNLQTDLVALGYKFNFGIDGRFGDETKANVIAFQNAHKLTPDGRVGAKTRAALNKALEALETDKTPAPPVWEGQEEQHWFAALVAAILAWFKKG